MKKKNLLIRKFRNELENSHQLLGIAAGSGIIAKYAAKNGADFIMCLSSGFFRNMGRGSYCAYLPVANSNEITMQMGAKTIIPVVGMDFPVLFGLNANDPTMETDAYLYEIVKAGFSGVVNYPTVSLIDGRFRQALEADGQTFEREALAIANASDMGLFTVGFVTDPEQAQMMMDAGADVICAHMGLTKGGKLGSKTCHTLEAAMKNIGEIFSVCEGQSVFRMVYGGPFSTLDNLECLLTRTTAQGFICGSSFERILMEQEISKTVWSYKNLRLNAHNKANSSLKGTNEKFDYLEFVTHYVAEHYQEQIVFNDVVKQAYCSRNHLSWIIRVNLGCTFTEYLSKYRIAKALPLIKEKKYSLGQIAEMVGFGSYLSFSKYFMKYMNMTPKEYKILGGKDTDLLTEEIRAIVK